MCLNVFFKSLQCCGILQRQGNMFHDRGPQIEKALVPRARGTSRLLQDFYRNTPEGLSDYSDLTCPSNIMGHDCVGTDRQQ